MRRGAIIVGREGVIVLQWSRVQGIDREDEPIVIVLQRCDVCALLLLLVLVEQQGSSSAELEDSLCGRSAQINGQDSVIVGIGYWVVD